MAPSKGKTAYWIGVPEEAYQATGISVSRRKNETAYFRTEFNLNQQASLQLRISANSRYRLWVNDIPVNSGPLKGDRYYHYYDVLDVSEHLRVGHNILAVKVVAYPAYESGAARNQGPLSVVTNGGGPCLMVEGVCKARNGRAVADITTGHDNWTVSLDEAIQWAVFSETHWMGAMEHVDGRKLPSGWTNSKSPEGQWFNAERLWPAAGNPSDNAYGIIPPYPLHERPVPLLYETRRLFKQQVPSKNAGRQGIFFPSLDKESPVKLAASSKYRIILDAGELTTGYFRLPVFGGSGSRIAIRYAECFVQDKGGELVKGVRDDESGIIHGHEDVYLPSGREEIYEPFWFRTFRFVQIDIDTGSEPLYVKPPVYLETGYPLDVKSSIHSSDEWANGIWDISLRTLKRCMHETYEDCPYYEQLQYAMDTRLQILFTYMVSGDVRMAQKAMRDLHSSLLPNGLLQSRYPSNEPQVIPTFSLYFIMMVEDYYWQTGDTSHIRQYRAAIDGILEWFSGKIGRFGMIEDLGYWPFVDWVEGWARGVPKAALKGPATIHNLLYVAGLQSAARLNELTGRTYMAEEYLKRARDILTAIEENCWSNRHGLFKEGPGISEFSQHTQAFAVLTGLVKGKRAKSILKKCFAVDNIYTCSYAMRFYLLRALEAAGLYERSIGVWDSYRKLLEDHLTTCPEDDIMVRSDCHGWSALPLYEFTRCILGVSPLLPGWEKIQIKPHTLDLNDCSGSVVTPKGIVRVSWTNKRGVFSIQGTAPEGVPLELHLPDGTTQIYINGGAFEY
ncbi:MAG TPA: family 78 glycoside hydrolase catalytic domain [Candidatus Atribacteria bacterium]|nr:family 78 glycoside hydrolase catalytic domain [Candidatus Atribacteria bacterium]